MPRLITLECDSNEVRVAIGSSGLTGVSIEHILSGPIQLPDSQEPWGSEAAIEALRSLLAQAGVKSGDAIVCVSRNDIELRAITLPDVDSNELPDMVRFAAPRYFANVGDQWPLDFITMPSHLEGSIDCVVGAISPALIQLIERTVTAAGLHLTHMVLRPMAAVAGAMARNPDWMNASVLFMDLLNEEADVVISERGNAVFMRTFHSPGDASDPEAVKLLTGEIKRTLLSAASQRSGLKVDRIVLWTKDSLAPVAEAVGKAVELPVTMLNPFSWADKADIAIAATTQTVGRFAPILGAFHFLQQRSRLIDFSNPRKRVEKKQPIGRYAAAAGLGVALLGGAAWWYVSSHSALDSEIALLKQTIDNEANTLKLANKHAADWKKVENFLKGDIRWIDELETLSARATDSEKAYFGTTTFMLEPRSNVASISAKFFAKSQDVIPGIQAAYRDANHTVRGTAITNSPDKSYPEASDLTITLAAADVPDPRKATTPTTVAAPSAETTSGPANASTEPAAEPLKPLSDATPDTSEPKASEPKASEPNDGEPKGTVEKSNDGPPPDVPPPKEDATPPTPTTEPVILGGAP